MIGIREKVVGGGTISAAYVTQRAICRRGHIAKRDFPEIWVLVIGDGHRLGRYEVFEMEVTQVTTSALAFVNIDRFRGVNRYQGGWLICYSWCLSLRVRVRIA